jgi:hypothetical protein
MNFILMNFMTYVKEWHFILTYKDKFTGRSSWRRTFDDGLLKKTKLITYNTVF